MSKRDLQLSLDAALIERVEAEGDVSAVVEKALLAYLDGDGDHRWAEENALVVEALAGGAEEVKA